MTFAADILAVHAQERAYFGGVATTYAAGATNTKAIASTACFRKDVTRTQDPDGGLDRDSCTFVYLASEFAAGFSASNPVVPGARHTITVAGEAVWTVGVPGGDAARVVNGVLYVIRASRRRQRGAA